MTEQTEEKPRRERKPFGGPQPRLDFSSRVPKGKGYYVFNDSDSGMRIQRAIEAGYSFLRHDGTETEDFKRPGQLIRERVGLQQDGITPLYAYPMVKPKEWIEEDYAKKQEEVDQIDQMIKTGEGTALGADSPDHTWADPRNKTSTERTLGKVRNQ